jgi:hypothetical protein
MIGIRTWRRRSKVGADLPRGEEFINVFCHHKTNKWVI